MLRDWPRIIPISRVEGGLAAAGLIRGELDFAPNLPKHAHRVETNLGIELVHKARNEQRHTGRHAWFYRPKFGFEQAGSVVPSDLYSVPLLCQRKEGVI
jgi:hypothetical protein